MTPLQGDTESRACLDAAKKLCALSWLARREGLLALADASEQEPDAFLKAAIETLLDTLGDEVLLAEALYALLAGSGARGEDARKNSLIVQGLLYIYGNVRPDELAQRLKNWLGADSDNKEETEWKL